MEAGQKTYSNPVFEMILKTAAGENAMASARPSNFALPEDWHEEHQDGQLSVDVAQTEKEIVIISTMAGAATDKIEVYLHNDLLTIRGQRVSPLAEAGEVDYFHQECFWGRFSRTIVLPIDIKPDSARAEYRNGVLIIHLLKQRIDTKIPVMIEDE
ncbi:MAG: Hsp20/alpha crystallin family protein [Candidatus Magasanikbacteria bacterium]|nr:Hsp20/alpha crystallin family protein [Candidatus Magasanikbacteria bacterium]